jgi:hypothetical protein
MAIAERRELTNFLATEERKKERKKERINYFQV